MILSDNSNDSGEMVGFAPGIGESVYELITNSIGLGLERDRGADLDLEPLDKSDELVE